jgi:PEP-CTERM motif
LVSTALNAEHFLGSTSMAASPVYFRRTFFKFCATILGLFALGTVGAVPGFAQFTIGPDALGYTLLFEGGGTNTLQITNVAVVGNVGVGGTGLATVSGPSLILGAINFAAGNTGQFANNNASNVILGGVHYTVASVANALTAVNTLNTKVGAEAGTNLSINLSGNTNQTINITSGTLDKSGNYVFNVKGFNTTNGNTLTIVGNGKNGVVFNFEGLSANFNNQVVLKDIAPDQVLWNFVGGSNLTGGPTLQINDNASGNNGKGVVNLVQGDFLDPNGPISIVNADILGRVFGGDTHDYQDVSGSNLNSPSAVPEPSSMAILAISGFGLLALFGRRRWRNA